MRPTASIHDTFAALGDPTRRAIVERLAAGEATVLELAAPFDISLPAISRHLKVLEKAGLITRGRDAQRRPCRLRPEALAEVSAWAEHTKRAWEQRFDQLERYLERLPKTEKTTEKTKTSEPKIKKENDHAPRRRR